MLHALLAVMVKELRQAFRDKRTVFMMLGAPVIQLVILGYAVNLDVDQIPTVVVDQDKSVQSRSLSQGLLAGSTFKLMTQTQDVAWAMKMLDDGLAAVAVIFPPGIGRDMANGRPVQVQVILDGTDPTRAKIAANSATQYFNNEAMGLALSRLQLEQSRRGINIHFAQIRLEPRTYYNPTLSSSIYMVPGVLGMLLVVVTSIVTAMGIARERESGTMEQILVTPIRPSILLAGKTLPFALLGLLTVAAVLLFGSILFQVPMRGSLLVIFSASLLYLMTTLGAGVLVAAITSSQQQAVLGTMFFVTPAILLSGFMTPIENMPHWIRPLTLLNPMRYFIEIMRANQLKGAGFSELYVQFLALFGFGVLFLFISASLFKKQLS